ncbi:MAG: glycosyltransferase family 9 protein [Roseiflexaceae bacterium]|nr:glycosyltransferase family 9 protein [Roseiflexaceae bacterium]
MITRRRAAIAADSLGLFARTVARHGRPRLLLTFAGGLGDQLLCTAVLRELRQRGGRGLWMMSGHADLFSGSGDLDALVPVNQHLVRLARAVGAQVIEPRYASYDPAEDRDHIPVGKHIITVMCELAGLRGEIALRPYVKLGEQEQAAGRYGPDQIVLQSSGLSARYPMRNKEWLPERMQQVADALAGQYTLIQIGAASDPPITGAHDLRGSSLRRSAAALSQAQLLIGLVGFPMHLARAVNCRSVIVYGGRENPAQSGYVCNEHVYNQVPCAPCWKQNDCPYDRRCMREISVEMVLAAVQRALLRASEPLATALATI